MSDLQFVAVITGAFFIFGIAFGALAVMAASALRKDGERRTGHDRDDARDDALHGAGWPGSEWPGGWTDTTGTGWEEPPGPDDGGDDNAPPRWPGGAGRR